MYVVCLDLDKLDSFTGFVKPVVEPIAVFSTKQKAQDFAELINKDERIGSMGIEIIRVKYFLPRDPENLKCVWNYIEKIKNEEN